MIFQLLNVNVLIITHTHTYTYIFVINDVVCDLAYVDAVVPHGSILGPLLCLVEIFATIHFNVVMYPDSTTPFENRRFCNKLF